MDGVEPSPLGSVASFFARQRRRQIGCAIRACRKVDRAKDSLAQGVRTEFVWVPDVISVHRPREATSTLGINLMVRAQRRSVRWRVIVKLAPPLLALGFAARV